MWRLSRICQEVAIGLVEDQPDIVAAAELEDIGKEGGRVDGTRRIVRRDQSERLHARMQGRFDGSHIRNEAASGIAGHDIHIDAEHGQRRLVIEVIGIGHQNRIAGTSKRDDGSDEGLIAAGGDLNVAAGERSAVKPGDMRAIGRAQGNFPFDRPVASHLLGGCGLAEPCQHVGVRRISRYGLAQVEQWAAASVVALGPGGDRGDRRWRQPGDQRIEFRHGFVPVR